MIQEAGKTIKGWGRWELTKQGRKEDMEALKNTENVSAFPTIPGRGIPGRRDPGSIIRFRQAGD